MTTLAVAIKNMKLCKGDFDNTSFVNNCLVEKEYCKENKSNYSYMELPKGLQFVNATSELLFVRDEYESMMKMIISYQQRRFEGILVSGNPDIGKRWFLKLCSLVYSTAKEICSEAVSHLDSWNIVNHRIFHIYANNKTFLIDRVEFASKKIGLECLRLVKSSNF
jgi:hypothetical protein